MNFPSPPQANTAPIFCTGQPEQHRILEIFTGKKNICRLRAGLLVLCLSTIVSSVIAQTNFIINFDAKDAISYSVLNLDSVRIHNINSGEDTLVYGPNPSLNLLVTGTQAISYDERRLSLSDPYPNPAEGNSKIVLNLGKPELLSIRMSNMEGRLLYQHQTHLGAGSYELNVSTGEHPLTLVTLSTSEMAVSRKIIATPTSNNRTIDLDIQPIHSYPSKQYTIGLNSFSFHPGDSLLMTAYAANYQPGNILWAPQTSINFTFFLYPDSFHCGNDLVDLRDGRIYPTVLIGSQCWMAKNLNVGMMINGNSNQTDNGIIEKYCYDDDSNHCSEYGGLYQWDEAMGYSTNQGTQGICPTGWHIPSDAEWCTLTTLLDSTVNCSALNLSGMDAGGKLKATDTTHWHSPNTGATNSSGFTALGGGNRNTNSLYFHLRNRTNLWSSTEYTSLNGIQRALYADYATVLRYYSHKSFGYSLRCLKD